MLRKFDQGLLSMADRAVALAWTTFGVSKFVLVRFFALAFVIGAFMQAKALGQPLPAAAVGGASLACWTAWELMERRMPVMASNATMLALRATPLAFVLRYVALAIVAVPPFTAANLISGVCLAALILSAQALAADGARQTQKRPQGGKLAYAKVRSDR